MDNHSLFTKYPEFRDLLHIIRREIQNSQRPPEQVILDDDDVLKMLKISKRTLQYLKSSGTLTFSRLRNRSYYRLKDILDILDANCIQATQSKLKIKKVS